VDKFELDDIRFIMSLLKDVVEVSYRTSQACILALGNKSYARIDSIIAPALDAEMLLRRLFATNHPSIR